MNSVTAACFQLMLLEYCFLPIRVSLIGEFTNDWNYSLPDGSNIPRQLTDAAGEVTCFARYTPWGDTLSVTGNGNFTFGYFGGLTLAPPARALYPVGVGVDEDAHQGRSTGDPAGAVRRGGGESGGV